MTRYCTFIRFHLSEATILCTGFSMAGSFATQGCTWTPWRSLSSWIAGPEPWNRHCYCQFRSTAGAHSAIPDWSRTMDAGSDFSHGFFVVHGPAPDLEMESWTVALKVGSSLSYLCIVQEKQLLMRVVQSRQFRFLPIFGDVIFVRLQRTK